MMIDEVNLKSVIKFSFILYNYDADNKIRSRFCCSIN